MNAALPLAGATTRVEIVVYGLPAPQGSKRFLGVSKRTGRGILAESSAKVKPWREAVKAAAIEVLQRSGFSAPMDGPLRVRMVFTLPKPASAPKRRQTWPMRTPDGSKLQRSTEDALTDAGVWADDARVVEWTGAKRYPREGDDALHIPGARIIVEAITS